MHKIIVLSIILTLGSPVMANPDNGNSENPGAKVEFLIGDLVTFLKIILNNGKIIIREVGKK